MSKSLNDILKKYSDVLAGKRESTVSALTTGENPGVDYAAKMKDTRDFIAQHSVEKHEDRVGNGDDVYKAAKVKVSKTERHGHEPKPKDIKVYNKTNQATNEEVEQLDELGDKTAKALIIKGKQADNMASALADDAADYGGRMDSETAKKYDKNMTYAKRAYKLAQKIKDKKAVKEETELSEAKCNMSEAGTMCEVHGKKSCSKESDSASDKEPRYNGNKKEGKQLITDKKLQEKLTKDMSAGEVIKDFEKSDDPRFEGDTKEQRKKRALAAYYKLQREETVDESILDQRSAKATASEKAREKIFAALERRKEKAADAENKSKEKIKEQSSPTVTPITFPATNSREGFRV